MFRRWMMRYFRYRDVGVLVRWSGVSRGQDLNLRLLRRRYYS